MVQAAEQGSQAPEATHSPSDWAAKLHESSKSASQEDEQPSTPQAEEAELEDDAQADSEGEAPTENEDQDTADDEDAEDEALDDEEDAEPSNTEPEQVSIAADDVYLVDGEEIDGQTLLNGIAATKNFAQEKHRLREESAAALQVDTEQLHARRDEYAQATTFMLGMNQQAMDNINNQLAQTQDPQQFQALRQQQGQMQQAQQQLQGQFDQFLTQTKREQADHSRKQAESSLNILRDRFGGEENWTSRYPQIRTIAGEHGFSADEFNQWTDHRLINVFDDLDKANKQISDMKSIATKKTANTVKEKKKRNAQRTNTLKPRQISDAMDNAKKTHKSKDWANAWQQSQSGANKGR